jgi:hypothetical protein
MGSVPAAVEADGFGDKYTRPPFRETLAQSLQLI